MPLLGPNGEPVASENYKKEKPPRLGPSYGAWGPDIKYMALPGGGTLGFNLDNLTLSDYRAMRDHYQINSSLALLNFMQHQSDWHIECDNKKIAVELEDQLREIWTPLTRALGNANWAGYSPNVLEWQNDITGQKIVLDKVKDLPPENALVKWKKVKGYKPPNGVATSFNVYDGIRQISAVPEIPAENTIWYPLLMEHGDYYGTKLLRPAFTSWFFSLLLHLFANRYYERFGEPIPVGRGPTDDTVEVDGSQVSSRQYVLNAISDLRSRGAIFLPSDKTQHGEEANPSYDYTLEYLESQMRGADFERYMTRLDEEMSIGLFTPILLMRTADVGSYNLGVGHMQIYLFMLNAMNGDRKTYIDKYILTRMKDYNFGKNAPKARIVFRKLGNSNAELIKAILSQLTTDGHVKFDMKELGNAAGLTLEEVKTLTPGPESSTDVVDNIEDNTGQGKGAPGSPRGTGLKIAARIQPQIANAFARNELENTKIDLGYNGQFINNIPGSRDAALEKANKFYTNMNSKINELKSLGAAKFTNADQFHGIVVKLMDQELYKVENAP